jgi:hypothetical protein
LASGTTRLFVIGAPDSTDPHAECGPGKTPGRDGRGHWLHGVSGNPGGGVRPSAEVVAMARAYTTKAIETLVSCLEAKSGMVRVVAANALLDRAWGKPKETHEITPGEGSALMFAALSASQMAVIAEQLSRRERELAAQMPALLPASTEAA